MKRILFAAAALAVLGAGAFFWFAPAPSFLLKLLPAPDYTKEVIAGDEADGKVIDLNGGWLNGGRTTELRIKSVENGTGWACPEDIVIRNGNIRGSIRIMGLGRNGEDEKVRASSVREGHTARAQAAAPRRIILENLRIEADHRIPLYLAPGVTGVVVRNCVFTRRSVSTAVYLCAETADNIIENNEFAVETAREVVALDGSAHNRIVGNRFNALPYGGIYLYRNCGEGGTVRHQTPRENVIADNVFAAAPRRGHYAVWIGSRGGRSLFCGEDAGYSFGSSADDGDHAHENTVTGNIFAPDNTRRVRDDGANNRIDAP